MNATPWLAVALFALTGFASSASAQEAPDTGIRGAMSDFSATPT